VVLRRDVRPYEATARRLVRINRKHDAIKLVCKSLSDMLASSALLDHGKPTPKRMDVEGRLRRELARLHSAGVTGRTILILALSLHIYARNSPGVVGLQWLGTRRHRFALARHVLQFTRRNRRDRASRVPLLSPRVLDLCGERMIQITDQLLTALEPAFARQSASHQGSPS